MLGKGRNRRHAASVVYVFDKRDPDIAYYGAVCNCGWFEEPVDSAYPDTACASRMAAAALAHDPGADTTVGFPLDEPSTSEQPQSSQRENRRPSSGSRSRGQLNRFAGPFGRSQPWNTGTRNSKLRGFLFLALIPVAMFGYFYFSQGDLNRTAQGLVVGSSNGCRVVFTTSSGQEVDWSTGNDDHGGSCAYSTGSSVVVHYEAGNPGNASFQTLAGRREDVLVGIVASALIAGYGVTRWVVSRNR